MPNFRDVLRSSAERLLETGVVARVDVVVRRADADDRRARGGEGVAERDGAIGVRGRDGRDLPVWDGELYLELGRFFKGNPDLKPETSDGFTVVAESPTLRVSNRYRFHDDMMYRIVELSNLLDGELRTDQRLGLGFGLPALAGILSDLPPGSRRILLVGHNPGLRQLVNHLCGAGQEVDAFPAGALAHLQLDDDWGDLQAGQGRLLQLVRAKGLPNKFPFPSPYGDERRDRPTEGAMSRVDRRPDLEGRGPLALSLALAATALLLPAAVAAPRIRACR